MVIKILYLWFILYLIGALLLPFRSDYSAIRREIELTLQRGTIYHALTIVIVSIFLLPISIFYSIKNILNK